MSDEGKQREQSTAPWAMSMIQRHRKIVPFVAALVLAFVVVLIIQATNGGVGFAYGLIGFVAGVLGLGGTIFAFALRPVHKPPRRPRGRRP